MALDDARHPDAERLAEYADDVLDSGLRDELEQHFADCAECRAVVMETSEFLHSAFATADPAPKVMPFLSRRWLVGIAARMAAAAALVLAVPAARPDRLFGSRSDRPELQELIAAVANEPTRLAEGRLSGGFHYAPPPALTRGAGEGHVTTRVRIAAAKLEQEARDHPRRASRRAGCGRPRGRRCRWRCSIAGVRRRAGTVRCAVSNDLAVAYMARARRRGAASDWTNAIAAAERAVAANPSARRGLVQPRVSHRGRPIR